jgi:hypothetical protein
MRVRTTLLAAVTLALTMSAGAQNEQQFANEAEDEELPQNAGGGNLGNGLNAAANQNAAGNDANAAQNQNGAGNDINATQNQNAGGNNANAAQNQNAAGGNENGQGNFGNNANGNASQPVNNVPFNNVPVNPAPINNLPANPVPVNSAPINGAASANSAATDPNTAAATPATAPASGPPAEMRFQFDQRGTPSLHSFVLKWANTDGNLASIEVIVSDTQEVIQTIAVPQDGSVKLIYKELSDKPGRIKDKFFDFIDYNFDNFGDIRLTRQWPFKVGEKFYLVWLFDEASNQYILHEGISALPAALPDPKTRRIESVTLGGWGGGEYEKRWHSLTSKGKLKLQTLVKQTVRDRSRLVFNREVRQRINGEMQRICKLVVPTEGKIQRLWGSRERCDYHMQKHPL